MKRMNEKSKENLEWSQTLTKYIWDNNFPGYVRTNFAKGGYIIDANIYLTLKPGEYIEIKKK